MVEDKLKYASLDDIISVLGVRGGDSFLAKEALKGLLGLRIRRESGKDVIPEEQLTFAVRYLLNNYKDIGIRWSPEQVEELRGKYKLDDIASQGPAMPSATAMIAPQTELISQDDIGALVDEASEKPTRHIPQELVQQAMYGGEDTSRETAEKGSGWEAIVAKRVGEKQPPSSAETILGHLSSNLRGNAAIQARLSGTEIRRTRTAYAPRAQTQPQRTYAPQQNGRLTSSGYDALVNERLHAYYLLPGESNSCFAFKTLSFNYKLVHNQDGSISRAKVENALRAFADDFWEFCELTEAPILCPTAFNKAFGGNARREYIRHFNETMIEYVELIEPQLRSST